MANTPNLDLVKPAGTDHALVSVINANSDKIDSGFGTLSEQIAKAINDFGSKTIAGMNTAIEGKLSSMSVGESVSFKVTLTDTDSVIATSGAHTGIATKSADDRINATLIRSGTSIIGYYCGTKTSNGWVWQQIAAGTEFNTVAISTLADLQTYLDGMPAGKTSTLLLSGAASNAVCGSTYTCNVTVSKVDNNFADLRWSRSNADAGYARYQKTSQTFLVEHLVTKSETFLNYAGGARITEADNVNLIGIYFGRGSECNGLPTTSNTYYFLLCFFNVQLAINSINTEMYTRCYINNAWASWRTI